MRISTNDPGKRFEVRDVKLLEFWMGVAAVAALLFLIAIWALPSTHTHDGHVVNSFTTVGRLCVTAGLLVVWALFGVTLPIAVTRDFE